MKVLALHIFSVFLLWSCASTSSDEHINFHVLTGEYKLVSMKGHSESLKRDKEVLGEARLRETTLISSQFWNGKHNWLQLNIGGGCVKYENTKSGPLELPHRCTELYETDGGINEYLPYSLAGRNFIEVIAPQIAETAKSSPEGEIVWLTSEGEELARFVFKRNYALDEQW